MTFSNSLIFHEKTKEIIAVKEVWICRLNRPFPSSPQPPFQSEAKCEVFVMKISFHFIQLKLKLIIITKVSHLDSL